MSATNNKRLPPHGSHHSVFYITEPVRKGASKFPFMNVAGHEISSKCLSQLLKSQKGICLKTICKTPGCGICCLCVHLSDSICVLGAVQQRAVYVFLGERNARGLTFHFFLPSFPPPILSKKKKKKKTKKKRKTKL